MPHCCLRRSRRHVAIMKARRCLLHYYNTSNKTSGTKYTSSRLISFTYNSCVMNGATGMEAKPLEVTSPTLDPNHVAFLWQNMQKLLPRGRCILHPCGQHPYSVQHKRNQWPRSTNHNASFTPDRRDKIRDISPI